MHYVVSVLLLCLSVAMAFMQYYKSTAENKSKQLESISALHAQNMAMLSAYERIKRIGTKPSSTIRRGVKP